jgi:hypothetical protein
MPPKNEPAPKTNTIRIPAGGGLRAVSDALKKAEAAAKKTKPAKK